MKTKNKSLPFIILFVLAGVVTVLFSKSILNQFGRQENNLAQHQSSITVNVTPSPNLTSPDISNKYPEGWTEYKDEENGFLFAYPDMKKIEPGIGVASYKLSKGVSDPEIIRYMRSTGVTVPEDKRLYIGVTGDAIATIEVKNEPLDVAIADIKTELLNLSMPNKEMKRENVRFGTENYPAVKITYGNVPAGIEPYYYFFVYKNNKTYILQWAGDSDYYWSYNNSGKEVFSTFTIF